MATQPTGTSTAPARHRFWQVPVAAFAGAVLFAAPSLTPSLLPHAGAIQGIVTGVAAACGYGLGLFLAVVVGAVLRSPGLTGHGSPRVWRWLAPSGLALLAVALVLGQTWQSQLRTLIGAPPGRATWWLSTAVVAVLICSLLVAIGRAVRRLASRCARAAAGRGARRPAARVIGVLAAAAVTLIAIAATVAAAFLTLQAVFGKVNDGTTAGVTRPTTAPVSGSDRSTIPWESLGTDGRDFVSSAPSQEQIRAFSGQPATEPVRAYAGVKSAESPHERAQLAVEDLERLGGFARSVLMVATSTGTGFLDPGAIEPLELMYGGDTAVVSLQYSTLPSWLSFLVDQEHAASAGTELFAAVHARWSELSPDQRPRLIVFGESLGAFGAESAFADLDDVRARTGGALMVGPPEASALHAELTEQRDPGSPQWQPVVGQGTQVRFAAQPEDLDRPDTSWTDPRIGYLQNASDPVVWWSPRLLWSRPDWLSESPAPGTWQQQRWLPLVTFLKVTGDMMDSTSVPVGHGHVYGWHQVGAWARIAPPSGWLPEDTARLEKQFE